MPIWDDELKELRSYRNALKNQLPSLEQELKGLLNATDAVMTLTYARRSVETLIDYLWKERLQRERDTTKDNLRNLVDTLKKDKVIPENLYPSVCHAITMGNYGAHPKELGDKQVKEGLLCLTTTLEWFIKKYLGMEVNENQDSQPLVAKKVVISYKRGIQTDEYVVNLLNQQLTQNGHQVFIDRHLKVGDEWKQQITQYIRQADALIVLLSAASIYSEMLAEEIELAYQIAQEHQGVPRLLPVRINFSDPLPQNLANLLGKLQYAVWRTAADDGTLVQQLVEKIATPVAPTKRYELEMVGGAIPLDSKFYIERPVDQDLQTAIRRQDSIVLLKGARQVGKTSLLARGLQQAREAGVTVLLTDFQWLDRTQLESLETFFIALGEILAQQLDLDISPRDHWNLQRAPKMNFDRFFRRELLSKTDKPILWAIDEADRLFLCPFSNEVFSLFRVWHNERATQFNTPCSRLTLMIAYATETYFFIKDPAQSPFNVGTKLVLEDFTLTQLQELHQRYGSPLDDSELNRFFQLTHGQPYLARRGFNEIVAHHLHFADFLKVADQDEGPFGDHLRRIILLLSKETPLATVVRGVLAGHSCPDHDSFYRLRGLGVLIGESKDRVQLRCELYTRYLNKYLT